MADHRRARVEHLLRAELASLLQTEAKDPRLATVTVSEVRMTADLRQARVFFRLLDGTADAKALTKALERAAPFLRRQLGRRLRLRRIPELQFFYDESIERHDRIERILQELEVERVERAERNERDGDD
jgi:ribosome-binding factor A